MNKTRKRSKRQSATTDRSAATDRSATTDIVTQLECAVRNPHAALIGALIGGLVPWFARTLAHEEVPAAWAASSTAPLGLLILVICGCAVFSALTVYRFGQAAFGDSRKALGFVLALEGVMIVSHGATSAVALVALIAINAVANGSVIALSRDATKRRAEADARRAATRRRGREAGRAAQAGSAAQVSARSVPIVKVEDYAQVAPRSRRAPQHTSPVWRSAPRHADAIDAEIISEQRLLA